MRVLFATVLLCVLAFGALIPMPAFSQVSTEFPPYRFVDINEVVASYEKAKKEQDLHQKSSAAQLAEFQRREDELAKKKRELAPLNRNSQEYAQKAMELEIEQLKLQREGDFFFKERDKKRLQLLIAAYDDIRAAVKKYAEANGLKAVFVVQKDLGHEEEELQERSMKISLRQVLYYDSSLDVTGQIIKLLNNSQ